MANLVELDNFDQKILRVLQDNADYSMAELGDKVGLSHTPCWRRIKRLEADGIIERKVTLLNAEKLGLSVTVHTYIRLNNSSEEIANAFERAVADVEEIMECYSTSGEYDYLLKIIVTSIEHYERLARGTLAKLPNVCNINTTFALKCVKRTTKLPL